ncbi:MAG: hypothetical protein DMG61_03795 [Acidobacteria bacterium]|nr:MAG: hypothetical protein DMG61_03795 [Acidobacteriota bacterium]
MGSGSAEVPSFIDLGRFPPAIYQNPYRAVKIAGCNDPQSFPIFTFRKRPYGKLTITGDRFFGPLTKFRTALSDLVPIRAIAQSCSRFIFEFCFI